MRLVTVGVGCLSPTVGDLDGNLALLEDLLEQARRESVDLLVTPELGISGYSLGDRVLWEEFPDRCLDRVAHLARRCTDIDLFVGTPVRDGGRLFNALVLCAGGEPVGMALKQRLPNYGVFYEARQWTPWPGGSTRIAGLPAGELLFDLPYGRVAAEICEDLWAVDAPSRKLARHGAELIVNGAASPFTAGMQARRLRLILGQIEATLAVYAYANLLGCDSSRLVFEGGGLIATPTGDRVASPRLSPAPWTLRTLCVDLDEVTTLRTANSTWRTASLRPESPAPEAVRVDRPHAFPDPARAPAARPGRSYFAPGASPARPEPSDPSTAADAREALPDETAVVPGAPRPQAVLDDILDALALGIRDYFRRAGAFQKMLVALSGGRDSALTLIAAWRAALWLEDPPAPGERVEARYLPTRSYSSTATQQAAEGLAQELGIPLRVVDIQAEFELAQEKLREMLGPDQPISPIALQNAQARIRGSMMLNWANCVGGLVLVTSNMSEFAVGYFTTGGDNQGGFAPISGLPKTLVNQLLERAAARWSLRSLEAILSIPPSAELAPDQRDEADLMPYPVLDDILYLYAAERRPAAEVFQILRARRPEYDAEQIRAWVAQFVRRLAANQWKRDQSPVGLKMLDLDLDPKSGFRFPVIQSVAHELSSLDAASPAASPAGDDPVSERRK